MTLRLSFQGQSLLDFLVSSRDEPDTTMVEFYWLPYIQRQDGSLGPPMIPLGRLREEFILREAFPHHAQVRVQ